MHSFSLMVAGRLAGCFWTLLLALAASLLAMGSATPHEVRPAIATATVSSESGVRLSISLNLEALMAGIEPDHADTSESPNALNYDRLRSYPPAQLNAAFEDFKNELFSGISLAPPSQSSNWVVEDLLIPPVGDLELSRISELILAADLPIDVGIVTWRLDPDFGDSVIRLADPDTGEITCSEYVQAGQESRPLPVAGGHSQHWTTVLSDYVTIGFVHILPKGLDHILFVVGLFLLTTSMGGLLWQITAFTVAHTVTLALGVTGVIFLSEAIVEPLIAASIVYVAIENLLTRRIQPWRPLLVFGFGLLHGLGFAGVLAEVGLVPGQLAFSLIGFNIGVELGQIAVIAICFAAVGWAMAFPWYRRFVVVPGSLAIAAVGAFWFVERVIA